MENIELMDTLHTLLATSRDGDKGYSACADDAKDAALRAYFKLCATRCRESVQTLDRIVKHYGGSPGEAVSFADTTNRAWINLRAATSGNNDLAVLEECERAEDAALIAYRRALEQDLPTDVRRVIKAQCDGVQANHDRVRALRVEKRRIAA